MEKLKLEKDTWESFIKTDIYNILEKHDLQSITVDDGRRSGSIKVDSKGQVNVKITISETL